MKIESDSLLLSNNEIAGFLKKTCGKGIPFKFTAKGMSMSPFICDGDAVVIEPVCGKTGVKTGDIVAYICPGKGSLILHRVIKKKEGRYLLKGDNVYLYDGFCDPKDIHGIVKKILISKKTFHNFHRPVRIFFLFLNTHKKITAFLSRHKFITPVCRIANWVLKLPLFKRKP